MCIWNLEFLLQNLWGWASSTVMQWEKTLETAKKSFQQGPRGMCFAVLLQQSNVKRALETLETNDIYS